MRTHGSQQAVLAEGLGEVGGGARLFLVQENTAFIAASADKDERAAVKESFASSVLWSGEILASDKERHLVDFSSFLLADRHGVAASLAAAKQGAYSVDAARSAVLAASGATLFTKSA